MAQVARSGKESYESAERRLLVVARQNLVLNREEPDYDLYADQVEFILTHPKYVEYERQTWIER